MWTLSGSWVPRVPKAWLWGLEKTPLPFSKGLLKSLLGNESGVGGKSDRGADGALCQPALKIHVRDGLFQISPGRMSFSLPGHAGKALRLPPRAGATDVCAWGRALLPQGVGFRLSVHIGMRGYRVSGKLRVP